MVDILFIETCTSVKAAVINTLVAAPAAQAKGVAELPLARLTDGRDIESEMNSDDVCGSKGYQFHPNFTEKLKKWRIKRLKLLG